jgi:hypothetical protein
LSTPVNCVAFAPITIGRIFCGEPRHRIKSGTTFRKMLVSWILPTDRNVNALPPPCLKSHQSAHVFIVETVVRAASTTETYNRFDLPQPTFIPSRATNPRSPSIG